MARFYFTAAGTFAEIWLTSVAVYRFVVAERAFQDAGEDFYAHKRHGVFSKRCMIGPESSMFLIVTIAAIIGDIVRPMVMPLIVLITCEKLGRLHFSQEIDS